MDPKDLPADYVQRLRAVTDKRAKTFIDAVLKNGSVSTEELKALGYDHPPRAAADVKDLGFPLETTWVKSTSGARMVAYSFADPANIEEGVLGGRKAFPKSLKTALVKRDGERCNCCHTPYAERYLQVDHRIPYRVSGDDGNLDPSHFQLLCPSCNRTKSWSCEACENWLEIRDPDICDSCLWADPHDYEHVAMRPERRETIVWIGDEVRAYDSLRSEAGGDVVAFIKNLVASIKKRLG